MTDKYWNIRGHVGDQLIDVLVSATTQHRASRAVVDTLTIERVKPQAVIARLASGDRLIQADNLDARDIAEDMEGDDHADE